jgi:hypothetical protein
MRRSVGREMWVRVGMGEVGERGRNAEVGERGKGELVREEEMRRLVREGRGNW